MLEIWSNCNSMMSILVAIEGRETIQLDGFKNARKLDVGLVINCPEDEFKVYK